MCQKLGAECTGLNKTEQKNPYCQNLYSNEWLRKGSRVFRLAIN